MILRRIIFLFVLTLVDSFLALSNQSDLIIDSNMTFEQAVAGTKAPDSIIQQLKLIDVDYYSFDGKLHRGQLVIHKKLEKDIIEIFEQLKIHKFPISKVIPIVKYNWSDNASMEDNNTSAFNYRNVAGKNKLSKHSFGIAIDINPYQNPVIYEDGRISPKGATYNPNAPGTITKNSIIYKEFASRGWIWGGDWKTLKDNHHFEKDIKE